MTPRTKKRIASVASDHSYSSTKSKDKKRSATKTARQAEKKSSVSPTNEQKTPDMTMDQQQLEKCHEEEEEKEEEKEEDLEPEQVLDLVKRDGSGDVKCLVKYKGVPQSKWILAEEIRYTHPLLLINYYETRIILRKTQCDMAFDRTDSAPENRKLIVITSK